MKQKIELKSYVKWKLKARKKKTLFLAVETLWNIISYTIWNQVTNDLMGQSTLTGLDVAVRH